MIHTISLRKILIAVQCALSLLAAAALLFPFMRYDSGSAKYDAPGYELLTGNFGVPLTVMLCLAAAAFIINLARLFNDKVTESAVADYAAAAVTALLLIAGVYCFLICRGQVVIDTTDGTGGIFHLRRDTGSYMNLVCIILCALAGAAELLPSFRSRAGKMTAL